MVHLDLLVPMDKMASLELTDEMVNPAEMVLTDSMELMVKME
jgi:hypothetical protein